MKLARLGLACSIVLVLAACDKRTAALGPMPGMNTTGASTKTASGLEYWDVKVGEGAAVSGPASQVTFHATEWTREGKQIVSSVDRGEPNISRLDKAGRPGLVEGLMGMKAGGRRKLLVPPNLAYGEEGMQGFVPRNAVVVYDIDLLEVKNP